MRKTNRYLVILLSFVLLLLSACGQSAESTSAADTKSEDSANAEVSTTSETSAATEESATGEHDDYFVGTWDLYETEDATHEQVVQVMEVYANDPEKRDRMNEAYGRSDDDPVKFCMTFAADGTGEMDTGAEKVSFTWEAKNEGAVTFTSFGGKEYALHVPVIDGKITLDSGDTFAKSDDATSESDSSSATDLAEALVGRWEVYSMTNGDQTIIVDELDDERKAAAAQQYWVFRDDGTCSMYDDSQNFEEVYGWVFDGEAVELTFEGVSLSDAGAAMTFDGTEIVYGGYGMWVTMRKAGAS